MLRPDVFVVPAMGFLARLDQGATDSLGEVVACQKNLLVVALRFQSAEDIASTPILLLFFIERGTH